jgi:hypothetical protein
MTLPLTPDIIEAAYEFLRVTPPFKGWRLPPGDDVVFHVCGSKWMGYYCREIATGLHHISLSAKRVGHTNTVFHVMAHEMIHLHQAVAKTETANTEHNAEFNRLARQVCRLHGWDWKEFYR